MVKCKELMKKGYFKKIGNNVHMEEEEGEKEDLEIRGAGNMN